ncbi:hypothetical protein [Mucilaginibacter sp. CSA2-8R]|uniref:sacsin N-terminal ATP-binding-like domain-containing protein n=1 Tax=Mucilaginibacter sp. CSA2-8R TaxID=3141542 RepID=UPI00315DD6FA
MAYSEKAKSSIGKNNLKLTADKVIQILDQVRDEGKKSRRRWIWELMQNAKDIPNHYKRVSIEIELTASELKFKHNGDPFRIDNLTGLIQQVSSKPSDSSDEETTGKFGTGFISTHLLSDVITVQGVVQEPGEIPKKIELILDRSGETSEALMPAIDEALALVDKIDDNELFTAIPDYHQNRSEQDMDNVFIYTLENESAKQAAITGVDDLNVTLPLTLAFIPKIKNVKVVDRIKNKVVKYTCEAVPFSDSTDHITITIEQEGEPISANYFVIYNAGDLSLAAEVNNFSLNQLVERQPSLPFLYRDFPLIGTENFSFPFTLNGKTMNPTERRDGILLNQENEKSKKPAHNRKIIETALNTAKNFVNDLIARNAANLYTVALSRIPGYEFDEQARVWYQEIQKDYRSFLLDAKIIDTPKGPAHLKAVRFPRLGQINDDNLKFWDVCVAYLGYDHLPIKASLLTSLVHIGTIEEKASWGTELYFDLRDLLTGIAEAGDIKSLILHSLEDQPPVNIFEWLSNLYAFIIEQKQTDLFKDFAVIPNENGAFKLLDELFEEDTTKPIPDEFIDILKDLDPHKDWRSDLINRKINLKVLNHKKLDIANITEAINEILNESGRKGNIVYNKFLDRSDALQQLISILKVDGTDSSQLSFRHNIFNAAKSLYRLPDEFKPVANSAKFDYRPAFKLLIELMNRTITDAVSIQGLAHLMETNHTGALNWLGSYLILLDNSTEYSYFLKEGNIVPNRKYVLCAYEDICNFGTEEQRLDDDLVGILEKFNSKKAWASQLLADEIKIKLPNSRKFDELATELLIEVDQIRISDSYENYREQLLLLIDWCSTQKELALRYLSGFKELSTRIFFILTIENSSIGGDIIKMLRNKEHLEVLAQISESSININSLKELIQIGNELGSIEAILRHARELQYEQQDYEYKKQIGSEIEQVFKDALATESINAEVIFKGKGAYDFEIRNRINAKSFFIELKSQANGSSDPVKLALSQARLAIYNPESFALCLLERPIKSVETNVTYIKENLVYRHAIQTLLQPALDDNVKFEEIISRKTPVRLHIALRDQVSVSIENSTINESSESFLDLINRIKTQLL